MEYLDEDECPKEEFLDKLRNWSYKEGFKKLLDLVVENWWYQESVAIDNEEDYFNRQVFVYHMSTGGWSGSEEIIRALVENKGFWTSCWHQSTRGGHYIFKVRE